MANNNISTNGISAHKKRAIFRKLAERDGFVCFYCAVPLIKAEEGDQPDRDTRPLATIEHIKPRGRGGTHELGNLVLACRPCQIRRHSHA